MSPSQLNAPDGDVTFVFTDIEASSALWEAASDGMARALREHDVLMREVAATTRGYEVKAEGDAFMLAFESPQDALEFTRLAQDNLARLGWPEALENAQAERGMQGPLGLRVRMGVHAGPVEMRVNPVTGRADYFGSAVNITARLCDMGHGAQVLVSVSTLEGLATVQGMVSRELGPVSVRGMKAKVLVRQFVSSSWWPIEFPALRLKQLISVTPEARKPRSVDLEGGLEAVADQLYARVQVTRLAGHQSEALRHIDALQAVAHWLGGVQRIAECALERSAVLGNSLKFTEALAVDEELLELLDSGEHKRLYCQALLAKSTNLRQLYRYPAARRVAQQALSLSWQNKDIKSTAQVRCTLAELDRMEGNSAQAESGFRAALSVLRKLGDRRDTRQYEFFLGVLLVEKGSAEGLKILQRLEAHNLEINATLTVAAIRNNMALYYLDHVQADEFFKVQAEAQSVFKSVGHLDGFAAADMNVACMHLALGDYDQANQALARSAEIFQIDALEGSDIEGTSLLAWIALQRGDTTLATKAMNYLQVAAPKVPDLLGPMALNLTRGLELALDEKWAAMLSCLDEDGIPDSVTFRALWRSMRAFANERYFRGNS
ncbi:MAG: adenylate/guanylate cyclase domain-containing protein [Myxococcota bacterium]|nr:adenylate/guanylate cyclase domain-containing protein [Myxococcota bacterium]